MTDLHATALILLIVHQLLRIFLELHHQEETP